MSQYVVQTASIDLGDIANDAGRDTILRPVSDAIQCRVLIVRGESDGFCLITLDVTEIPRHPLTLIRNSAADFLQLAPEAVWIGVSHTHSSLMPNEIDIAALEKVVMTAVRMAGANTAGVSQAGFLTVDTGSEFAVNRRFESPGDVGCFSSHQCVDCVDDGNMVDGLGWARRKLREYGANEDELSAYQGPAPLDKPTDGLLQLVLLGDGKRPVAGIVRFNAHAVIVSSGYYKPHISRDYCGVLLDRLEEHFHCPMAFVQGFCGDQRPRHQEPNMAEAVRIGTGLADSLVAAEANVQWAALDCIHADSEIVRCDLMGMLAADLADMEARRNAIQRELDGLAHGAEFLPQRKKLGDRLHQLDMFEAFGRSWKYLADEEIAAGTMELEVSAVRLGRWRILAAPGEICSQMSLELRQTLGDGVMLGGFLNATMCYFVTPEQYQRGGYETRTSLFDPSCFAALQAAAERVVRRV